jgi:hypothetical protein
MDESFDGESSTFDDYTTSDPTKFRPKIEDYKLLAYASRTLAEKAVGSGYTFDEKKFKQDFTQNWEVLNWNQRFAYNMISHFLEQRKSHPENEKLRHSQNGPRGEQHHLLPKLLGGTDDSANLIHLSCGALSKKLIFLKFV